MRKPLTRWTADTDRAFLLALRLKGQVVLAAAEIGRAPATAYHRRQRCPEFAERWDAIVAEQQKEWIDAARGASDAAYGRVRGPAGHERFDGWTPIRSRAFLRALTETGHVREACARVRISDVAAYRLRAQSAEFAAAWDAALARSGPILEQIAYERAVEGWDEPIVYGGKVVGTRRRFSDALLRQLLARGGGGHRSGTKGDEAAATGEELVKRAHEAARAAGGIFATCAKEEETDALLRKHLDALAVRLRRKRANETLDGDRIAAGAPPGAPPRVR